MGCEYKKWTQKKHRLQVETHTCNHSYAGGGNQEDYGLRPVQQKVRDPILTNKLGIVVCVCGLRYAQGTDRRIAVQASSRPKKQEALFKNN
jgi:hypothetical protein